MKVESFKDKQLQFQQQLDVLSKENKKLKKELKAKHNEFTTFLKPLAQVLVQMEAKAQSFSHDIQVLKASLQDKQNYIEDLSKTLLSLKKTNSRSNTPSKGDNAAHMISQNLSVGDDRTIQEAAVAAANAASTDCSTSVQDGNVDPNTTSFTQLLCGQATEKIAKETVANVLKVPIIGCEEKPRNYKNHSKCSIDECPNYALSGKLCSAHGGGKRCSVDGCTKVSKGNNLCTRHGGGPRCTFDGCTKSSVGGGLCQRHGGGKRCSFEDCDKRAVKNNLCVVHGGGAPRCSYEGCSTISKRNGLCVTHGGAKVCEVEGCNKASRGRFCVPHGGGKRCSVDGCGRASIKNGLCRTHGSVKLCSVESCLNQVRSRGLCKLHGGGQRCQEDGCSNSAQFNNLCRRHGGIKQPEMIYQ